MDLGIVNHASLGPVGLGSNGSLFTLEAVLRLGYGYFRELDPTGDCIIKIRP